jgi:quinol monooxygenase YgiN
MQYVLIIHEVEDFAAWKTVFDDAVQIRKEAGEISYQLLRLDTDSNNIVHFSRWSSLQKARSFFESERLEEIRK